MAIMWNSITNENFDGHLGLKTKDQENFHKAAKIKIAKLMLPAVVSVYLFSNTEFSLNCHTYFLLLLQCLKNDNV